MSSRRAKAASAREEKLRQLRELRESGRTGLQAYEAKEDTDIFELVTEEEFKARARRNVLEDDFVVDDNGEGYADGGLEDWDNPHTDADSSDADGSGSGGSDEEGGKRKDRAKRSKGSKHGKRKRDKKAAAEAAPAGGSLIDMFNKKAQAPRAARPDAAATSGAAANTDLLASIFDDLDQDAERQAEKRRRVARMQPRAEPSQPLVSPPVLGRRRSTVFDTDEPLAPGSSSPVRASPSRTATAASGFTRKLVKSEFSDGAEALESEPLESEPLVAVKDEDVADANMADADIPPVLPPAMDLAMPEIKVRKLQTPSAKKVKSAASFLPKFEKESAAASTGSGTKGMSAAQAAEAAGCTNWKDVKGAVTLQSSQGESGSSISESSASAQSMCAEDGSLNLYWFDCIEKGDIVYLFGKAFHPVLDRFVSCCVAVKNIQRNLFVLPRATKLDDSGSPTDQPVDMADVYNEFDEIRRKYRITEFASRPVTRKYAFELPNIPSESDYLKVVYPFSQPELPADLKGRTFSHVFGTKTRALELLILKRKLMGPCWLKIENAQISSAVVSWCKFDVTVNDPKSIKVFADSDPAAPKQAPPFVVMSLSLRTVMNHQKQVNEIVAVSALVYSNVSIEGPTKDMTASRFTAIRQLSDIPIPVGFNDLASRQETRPAVHSNERSLLSFLLAVVQRHDPDALVGHNIVDFDLDVLLHRMKSNNVSHWSRIGRLRRTV
nr:DNA polymerase alpha catalytic subunit [Polyrhizophydium stewartii]